MTSLLSFDPRANEWIKMQSMLDSRTDFHVSVISGKVINQSASTSGSMDCHPHPDASGTISNSHFRFTLRRRWPKQFWSSSNCRKIQSGSVSVTSGLPKLCDFRF